LRVLTYNLHDLKDDDDAIARVIRAVRPDVACLQAMPRHPFSGHRIGALADACRLVWPGGGSSSGGTAVLTSMRVDERVAQSERLPVSGAFTRRRGYAAAVIAVPGGPTLTVASVHLSLEPDERVRHARAVLRQVQSLGPAPYVIAGDLGEAPGGPAWAAFATALSDPAGRVEPAQQSTYPARWPHRRIDAVLVSPGVTVRSVRVAGPDDGVDPGDLVAASNHLPVIADLEL
jgi:endonuclease/exonuclease/phosphatase family metal-dependent hydrolase